jgi:raffinose/stachyose/melibiose transport system substrate-binding protein
VTLPSSDPLFADEVTNARTVAASNSSVPYLDWATPTLLNTISVQMQNLMAGKASVNGAINAVKADDAAFRKTLTK